MTLMLVLAPAAATAAPTEVGFQRPIGAGLVAGAAPGLTAKFWTDPVTAVDLGLGFGPGTFACSRRFNPCGRRTSVNADYLWQSERRLVDRLSFHLGLGARLWFWDYGTGASDLQVAGRLPLGLDVYASGWLEVYGELAPSLAVRPSLLFLEGAVGVRFYP
jgi:hypothetical protein